LSVPCVVRQFIVDREADGAPIGHRRNSAPRFLAG